MFSIGLLSTAKINIEALLNPVRRRDDCQITAVASRHWEKAQNYAVHHTIPKAYGSYQALLEDHQIDAIYISTPNSLHSSWVKAGLEAGKHILCEKPLVCTYQELTELKNLALRQNLLFMEAMHYQYHPALIDFFRLIDVGILGPLSYVSAKLRYYRPPVGDIRLDPHLKGGCLMHLGCYCLDAITRIIKHPLEFTNLHLTERTPAIDLACHGTLTTTNQAIKAEFVCDFSGEVFDSEIKVVGDKGEVLLTSALNPAVIQGFIHDIFSLKTTFPDIPLLSPGKGRNTYDFQLDYFISLLKEKDHTPRLNEQATILLEKGSILVNDLLKEPM